MFWSLSMQLMPEEQVLEDSSNKLAAKGIKPAYSVFLTNKRVVFRFNGLGSSMAQSFLYHEISDVRPSTRMFVTYLRVNAGSKEHFLHIPEPAYWAGKIIELKKSMPAAQESCPPVAAGIRTKKQELLTMLSALRKHDILTETEFDQKEETDRVPVRIKPLAHCACRYSHSIVLGGLEEMSKQTRFTPLTSLMMRLDMMPSRSYGIFAQSAVMPSWLVTARMATTFS